MQPHSELVYVVDDDTQMRGSIEAVLCAAGYRVLACRTPDELLRRNIGGEPHCLVVDFQLPGMNGLQLCQEVLARNPGWSFVMITGDPDLAAAEGAFRPGAIDILQKPFDSTRLLNAVAREVCKARDAANRPTSVSGMALAAG